MFRKLKLHILFVEIFALFEHWTSNIFHGICTHQHLAFDEEIFTKTTERTDTEITHNVQHQNIYEWFRWTLLF